MRRPGRILAVVAVIVVFLLVSAGLARVLSANGAERTAITDLLAAQAHGNAAALVAGIDGCAGDATCRATQDDNARALRSTGALQIVRLDLSTGFSLGGTTGIARVVWVTPRRLTVVQCARVKRGGNVISGIRVHVLAFSRPIGRETSCPGSES
ncbi:MAG TPA: hypothetical protein VGM91_20435 [Conexibacter sp.]